MKSGAEFKSLFLINPFYNNILRFLPDLIFTLSFLLNKFLVTLRISRHDNEQDFHIWFMEFGIWYFDIWFNIFIFDIMIFWYLIW